MDDLAPAPIPTGRSIVQFARGADIETIKQAVDDTTGKMVDIADHRDFSTFADGIAVLDKLRIGLTEMSAQKAAALQEAECVVSVRPEFFLFDVNSKAQQWARAGLNLLLDQAFEPEAEWEHPEWPEAEAEPVRDGSDMTWGLRVIGAHEASLTGAGIKVAVLDTGLDFHHPDFAPAADIKLATFAKGAQIAFDGNGHGTHVAGTIAGPENSSMGRRYGVAPGCELYVGKVLADNGSGYEFDVLAGIEWALREGCHIISMSLGRAVRRNEKPDPLYEEVGRMALDAGSLIIAAAGNESARGYGYVAPVGSPANATTIMAVGSVDAAMQPSSFSCGGVNAGGGEVDICAPGSSIYSAWPRPRLSRTISGTSMACPHVSGIAALWAEGNNGRYRGKALWDALTGSARHLGATQDFGSGLAQAPRGSW